MPNSSGPRFPKPWVEEVEDEEQVPARPSGAWSDSSAVFIEHFPDTNAGAPISNDCTYKLDLHAYMQTTGALMDPDNFEIAELLMTTGLTNGERDRFLKSKLVSAIYFFTAHQAFCSLEPKYAGRTPWANCQQLLAAIDKLPHGPAWEVHKVEINDGSEVSTHYFYGRNIVQIVRELIGNAEHNDKIHYAPEQHWTSEDRTMRIYGEMWTARWWWRQQVSYPFTRRQHCKLTDTQILMSKLGRVTIAPLIIATDRTKLTTMCGKQQAYPVYVTIGNIRKSIRRKSSEYATLLLGYLPCEDFKHVKNPEERARLKNELVHRSMEALMAPLRDASKHGVEMWCADGRLRRVYPIMAAFVGDWPEQNDMACTDQGGCPICTTEYKGRGDGGEAPIRQEQDTVAALREYDKHKDTGELQELRLKPWMPWWEHLPHVNFHTCITPDLLHQLHQGLFKSHLVKWVSKLVGVDRVDACFQAMPRPQGMRHFAKGISNTKNWTGKESKQMASQILPIVAGQADQSAVLLARAILDFMYRAHASRMTEDDVCALQDALQVFHNNKRRLVELGVYQNKSRFDGIPKLHMLTHYARSIRELGTPDGYNSESPEHLHIVFAKVPWRRSNKVNPTPQMTKYVQRQEAIRIHRTYLNKYCGLQNMASNEDEFTCGLGDDDSDDVIEEDFDEGDEVQVGDPGSEDGGFEEPDQDGENEAVAVRHVLPDADYPSPRLGLATHSTNAITGTELVAKHETIDLRNVVFQHWKKRFKARLDPTLLSLDHVFEVWHRLYLHHQPLRFAPDEPPHCDVVRARPPADNNLGYLQGRASAFDVALFIYKPEAFGIHRMSKCMPGMPLYTNNIFDS